MGRSTPLEAWLAALPPARLAEIRAQAGRDFARRSIAGALGNFVLAALVLVGTPYRREYPFLAWTFAGAGVLVGCLRLISARRHMQSVPAGIWERGLLHASIYLSALMWSALMSAAVLVSWNQWPMWLVLFCGAGIGAGAAVSLASELRVVVRYLGLLLVPSVIIFLSSPSAESVVLAIVFGTFFFFLVDQTRRHHHWYWQGMRDNGTIVDLHERLQEAAAVQARRARERQVGAILDAAPFGAHLYQVQADGTLVLAGANRSADQILGLDHAQHIGRLIDDVFPAVKGTNLPDRFRRAAREGIPYRLDRFEYQDEAVQGIFEVRAVQVDPDRTAVFFQDISTLSKAYDQTLEGWTRALDLRDRETEGHTQRVTTLVVRLARALNVEEEELVHIRWGALLHDMGKIGVPDAILLKEGPLTESEWEVMRRHPTLARDMLGDVTFLQHALDIPYCHHEKWDGTGYPQGLKGSQIPYRARLFAVVDVWDALSHDRPYRQAWHQDKVRAHLRAAAGSHFDPDIVPAFLRLAPFDN